MDWVRVEKMEGAVVVEEVTMAVAAMVDTSVVEGAAATVEARTVPEEMGMPTEVALGVVEETVEVAVVVAVEAHLGEVVV